MSNNLVIADVKGNDLTQSLQNRGVTREDFRVLKTVIWPSAQTNEAVLMAVDYCRARGLDPMKRVVHIVPTWDQSQKRYVDSIWPGIAELRTTAMRTNAYAGRDEIVFGPDVTARLGDIEITYPEWAQCTVYRIVGGARVAFVGDRVYWRETYASKGNNPTPNKMWAKRPRGQIAKVAEANALRIAFPEEAGAEYTAEEMEGQAATGRDLESIDGEFESDLEDLNKRLGHKPAAEPRQIQPPAARPNGERRPPSRTRLLAAALKLIERADSIEDLADIEQDIEELPTGGGTRKTAREAWEDKRKSLQMEQLAEIEEAEEDQSAWIHPATVFGRIREAKDMDQLAEAEDLIGELLAAADQEEAVKRVRARAAELNEREVAGDD